MNRPRRPQHRARPAPPAGWLTLAAALSATGIVCGAVVLASIAHTRPLTIMTSGLFLAAADVFGWWIVAQGMARRRPHRAARRRVSPAPAPQTAPPLTEPFIEPRVLSRARPPIEWMPYIVRPFLMSAAERRFYKVLKKAVEGRGIEVFGKMRLADIVTVTVPLDESAHWERFRKISQKHVDFVLADGMTTRPLVAIELDDSSHEWDSRRKRDRFVNDVFEVAGLPLLRVQVRARYDARHLWHKIDHALMTHQNRMRRTG